MTAEEEEITARLLLAVIYAEDVFMETCDCGECAPCRLGKPLFDQASARVFKRLPGVVKKAMELLDSAEIKDLNIIVEQP